MVKRLRGSTCGAYGTVVVRQFESDRGSECVLPHVPLRYSCLCGFKPVSAAPDRMHVQSV